MASLVNTIKDESTGKYYKWNLQTSAYEEVSGVVTEVAVGLTPPSTPAVGDLWIDTS